MWRRCASVFYASLLGIPAAPLDVHHVSRYGTPTALVAGTIGRSTANLAHYCIGYYGLGSVAHVDAKAVTPDVSGIVLMRLSPLPSYVCSGTLGYIGAPVADFAAVSILFNLAWTCVYVSSAAGALFATSSLARRE